MTQSAVLEAAQVAVDVCSVPAEDRSIDEWMAVLGDVTRAMTMLAAARDAAVVRLAAIEEVVTEDGVISTQVKGLGTRCVDAGAMVSTATGTSARFGEEMVDQALTRVVRVPALHEAMLGGVLDDYKARRLSGELGDVPADLARAVVEALGGDVATRSGPALQRKARAILMSLCPDLLKERIRKARNAVHLRRWMGEPGTDAWSGAFPSERAARAWAAIDDLARQYRAQGRYDTLEQARAYALMDLVDGNTTVETVLHLSVPAAGYGGASADSSGTAAARETASDLQTAAGAGAGDFVAVAGAHGRELAWVPMDSVRSGSGSGSRSGGKGQRGGARLPAEQVCHRRTGALLDTGDSLATTSYRPGVGLVALVRQRDGGCRFPDCTIAARQCDIDHVLAWPKGPTSAANLICLCRRHHRVKQRHRWRVRLRDDGVVEWLDPAGRLHVVLPVDHLGAVGARVLRGVYPVVSAFDHAAAAQLPVAADLRDDLESTRLERWLAVAVEHVVAASALPRVTDRALAAHLRGVVDADELDELGRAVRAGDFDSIEDAIHDRRQRLSPGRIMTAHECRIDHHFGAGGSLRTAGVLVEIRPPRGHRRRLRRRRHARGHGRNAAVAPPF